MGKSKTGIGIAFFLNLGFSLFELIGGLFTGSVAILSDSVHDLGDTLSIGVSFALEKKSSAPPNERNTFGYARYSVLGGAITTLILILGSVLVVLQSVRRLLNPTEIRYDGMIVLSVIGVIINLGAAWFTRSGDSVNQRAVNLHMLEDVLGWIVVLIGAVIMRFTDIAVIDPLMSIGVAIFIFIEAIKNLKEILDIFLEKTPAGIDAARVLNELSALPGITEIRTLRLWTLDGKTNCAMLQAKTSLSNEQARTVIREKLNELGFGISTIEIMD